MTDFRVGDAVIINEFDAPETKMIAVVRKIQRNGLVRARYLSAQLRARYGGKDCFSMKPTHLSDFGCRLRFVPAVNGAGLHFCVEFFGASRATYSDGKPRHWQDRSASPHIAVDLGNPVLPTLINGPSTDG